jgi:hypothetical protein
MSKLMMFLVAGLTIGATAGTRRFGGPAGQIAVMHRIIVDRHGPAARIDHMRAAPIMLIIIPANGSETASVPSRCKPFSAMTGFDRFSGPITRGNPRFVPIDAVVGEARAAVPLTA